jgi:MYXO-CTERM domain-containing protein
VTITSPPNGQQVAIGPGESGADVRVIVDAQDNVGIAEVTLLVDGVEAGVDASAPYEFDVMLGSGAHELEALAVDLDDNAGHSSAVAIEVSQDGPSEGGSDPSGDDGGSDPSGSDDGGDPSDDDDGGNDEDSGDDGEGVAGPQSLPPGFGLGAEAAGCGCTTTTSNAWWLALALLGMRRRRAAMASPRERR